MQTYQVIQQLHTLSFVQFSRSSEPQKRYPAPICCPCKMTHIKWLTVQVNLPGCKWQTSQCVTNFNLNVNSRNVLFRFVELLGKIFCGSLAGYFHHGQLFTVSSHVARRIANAVIVVLLHKKICQLVLLLLLLKGKLAQEYILMASFYRSCKSLTWSYTLLSRDWNTVTHPTHGLLPKAGSAQSLYCSGVQTVEVPVTDITTLYKILSHFSLFQLLKISKSNKTKCTIENKILWVWISKRGERFYIYK